MLNGNIYVGNLFWLLLLIPILAGLLIRMHRTYILKTQSGIGKTRNLKAALPVFFSSLCLLALVAALVDFGVTRPVVRKVPIVHRLFVASDQSSSMYNFTYLKEPIYCHTANLRIMYPRIYFACVALKSFIDEVERFSRERPREAHDQVMLFQWALYSFATVPLTDDYSRFKRVLAEHNWRINGGNGSPFGIHTEIHLALWDLFLAALERNRVGDPNFVPLSDADIKVMLRALQPESAQAVLNPPMAWQGHTNPEGTYEKGKMDFLKEELKDTVFIFVTDALQGQLEQRLNKTPVSLRKMMQLAKLLEIPVYFISSDEMHEGYRKLAQGTGFGEPGSPYRGNFWALNKAESGARVEELVRTILGKHLERTVEVTEIERDSFQGFCGILALTFFLGAVWSRQTISRSLTEV